MADETIRWILDAVDNASDKFRQAADNFSQSAGSIQADAKTLELALAAAGAAAAAALGLAVKSALDEDDAITKAARATANAAGGFNEAKSAISELNDRMEQSGISTDKTTQAFTLLVTKAGRDVPTALNEAADLIAFAEERNLSLARAINIVTGEEKLNQAELDKKSAALDDVNSKLQTYQEQLDAANGEMAMTTNEQRRLRDLNVDLERAQTDLNEAVTTYGDDSRQARSAAERVADIQTRINDTVDDFNTRQAEAAQKADDLRAKIAEQTTAQQDLESSIIDLNTAAEEDANAFRGAAEVRGQTMTTTERLAVASENFNNLLQKAGEKLLPLVEMILSFLMDLMKQFDRLDPAMQDLIITLGVIGAAITAVIGFVAGLALALAPVIASIGAIATNTALIAWLGSVAAGIAGVIGTIAAFLTGVGEVLLIIAALAAAVAILYTAWNENWLGIRDLVQANVDNAISLLTSLITAVSGFVARVSALFEELVAKGTGWGRDLVNNVLDGINKAGSEISDAISNAASSAYGAITGTTGASGLAAQGVRPFAEGGIISSPTLALLGEGGENEYVIPESKMKAWLGANKGPSITMHVYGSSDPQKTADLAVSKLMSRIGASNTDLSVGHRVT